MADLRATNKVVGMSEKHKDKGITLKKIPEDETRFIAYHDAAWGNVSPDDEEKEDLEWYGNHTIASQPANIILMASVNCLSNDGGPFSVVDWKSKASHRVCRSTFAGETMAGCEAFENCMFLRSLFLSFRLGRRITEGQAGKYMDVHLITDCRSLYDHVHREGIPRAPSENRLAIDLAGLRQGLKK